jgi:ubiquinone/menaquinone biosynthesis C-methylase UbiE
MIQKLFDRTWSAYWQARAPQIFRLLGLTRHHRLLEVGCGDGLWTAEFVKYAGTVIAFDIDHEKVRHAASHGINNASFLVASVVDLPFRPGVFDRVTCIDVLENIPDDRRAIHEIQCALQPHGTLVISILRRERWSPLKQLHFSEYVREYSLEELQELFAPQGWRICQEFDFYRWFGTVSREGQMLLMKSHWLKWLPGARLVAWVLLVGLVKLDRYSKLPGGGVGMLVERIPEKHKAEV